MADDETTAQQTARELGGINANLKNINDSLTLLRDEMPCRSNDPNINPQARLTALETTQAEMKKQMGIVKKIGIGISALLASAALLLGAIAAWFKASDGGSP